MRVYWLLLIICIPIVIIFSNLLFLTFSENFYISVFEKASVYTQIDKKTAEDMTRELLGYFKGENILEHKYFSDQAIFHLKDVKNLLTLTQIIFILSTAIMTISTALLVIKNQPHLIKKGLILGSVATIFLSLLFVILLTLSFEQLFIFFHKIAFTNNLWQFADSDNLIKLFPLDFFASFAKQLLVNIITTASLIAFVSYLALKHD